MAKIVVEYDTNDKSCVVTQDGKKVKDWSGIMFQCYGEDAEGNDIHGMEMHGRTVDEDNNMSEHRVVYATKMKEYKVAIEKTKDYLAKKKA